MSDSLNDEEQQVLVVLYEELTRNPQTSLLGINERVLGEKVGADSGFAVMDSTVHLEDLGLVKRRRGKVVITQKGIERVKPKPLATSKNQVLAWIRDHIIFKIITAVVAALIGAMILYGWRPW